MRWGGEDAPINADDDADDGNSAVGDSARCVNELDEVNAAPLCVGGRADLGVVRGFLGDRIPAAVLVLSRLADAAVDTDDEALLRSI